MLEAVFFDLDGTLLDTLPDIRLSLNETLSKFGFPALGEKETRAFVGDGAKKLVERALPPGSPLVEEAYADFRARYSRSGNALTRPYDGVAELVAELKERGVKCAVVTNKPDEAAQKTIAAFFPGLFDFVGGDSGMFPCKPDPALCLYAALKMRTSRKNCIFVGDGETDVATARNAGMGGVFALWGYRSKAQLEAAGARIFAENIPKLRQLLFRMPEEE